MSAAGVMKVANWSDSEVINLIKLWGEEGIQEQLEGAKETNMFMKN